MVKELPPTKMVGLSNVSFSYNSSHPILKDISLDVEKGSIVMLLGSSGSGKTTLLKVIKGLLRPQRGEVSWGLDPAKEIAYIPQTLGLVKSLTVLENVLIGTLGKMGTLTSLLKVFSKEDISKAKETLAMLGLRGKEEEKAFHLSGGERQRVAIARALMQRSQLILADEFVSQLDFMRSLEMMELVKKISLTGVTFILTTHDIELVPRYGHRAVFIKEGQIVHECSATMVNEALCEMLK